MSFGNKNAKDGKEIVKEEISDKRVKFYDTQVVAHCSLSRL